MRTLLAALVLVASLAHAALLIPQNAILQTCAATCNTGCSRDGQTSGCATNFDHTVADGSTSMTVTYVLGTNTTVQLEFSIDNGNTWIAVSGSSHATTATPTNFADSVTNPTGRYRTNVTACGAGCTYITRYQDVREQ